MICSGEACCKKEDTADYAGKTITGKVREVVQGSSANIIDEDGAKVSLEKIKAEKNDGASSNTENGYFYGMNATVLATSGADVTIKNAEVTASAQNGNGIFSYGAGKTVMLQAI